MTDTNVTMMADVLASFEPTADGSGARAAEQISIEADRLGGTMKDGVEAVQTASKNYNDLVTDSYVRMVKRTMQNSVEFGNHALALLQARTPADAFKLNIEFVQKQVSSMQERLLEMVGMSMPPARGEGQSDEQA